MREEYPRPSFKRRNYQSLNGEWNFDFDDANEYLVNNKPIYEKLTKKIVVPFTYQTKLSGINDLSLHEIMWYEKTFDLDESLIGKNILLNFNAVDNIAMVFLNDVLVGCHNDGYTAFSFDVTNCIKEKNNKLVVRVFDEFNPTNPRGKQYWEKDVSRCWYNSSSGIWQSVWLESFEENYIKQAFITPNIDNNSVNFNLECAYDVPCDLLIEISYKNQIVKKLCSSIEHKETNITIHLEPYDMIDEIHYWTVENPSLYDVKLSLISKNTIFDDVETYFGFRKIHIDEYGNICLNNKRIYQRLILDQGYFDGGDLTPQTIEDLKKDILLAKEMGFNGARKHQKIEDPYYYYFADKLGFLVWAEMPSSYNFNHKEVELTLSLMQRIVKQLYNHPSIITWVSFNESWGVRKALNDFKQQSLIRGMYHIIKSIDNTRLVDSNDGWEQVEETDLIAIHDYSSTGDDFIEKYQRNNIDFVQPMGRRAMAIKQKSINKPVILTEYGGLSYEAEVQENFYGYYVSDSKEKLISDLTRIQENVRKSGLNGFCYTQLTDVKQETNGLLDSSHNPKYDLKIIRKIILGEYESKDFFN